MRMLNALPELKTAQGAIGRSMAKAEPTNSMAQPRLEIRRREALCFLVGSEAMSLIEDDQMLQWRCDKCFREETADILNVPFGAKRRMPS